MKVPIEHDELVRLLERLQQQEATSAVTMGTLCEQYLEQRLLPGARHPDNYRAKIRVILRTVGAEKLALTMTDDDLDAYRVQRAKDGLKLSSINTELATLYAAMQWACGKGRGSRKKKLIPFNPLSGSGTSRREEHRKETYLDEGQFEKLRAAANSYLALCLPLYFDQGFRRDELRTLRKDQVDLRERVIHLTGGMTKNGSSRDVPILTERSRKAIDILIRLSPASSPWVCANPRRPEEPVPDSTLDGWMRDAVETAKLKGIGGESITLHTLRHSCGVMLLLRGCAYPYVKRILGWRSDQVATEHYLNKMDRRIRNELSQLVERGIQADSTPNPDC